MVPLDTLDRALIEALRNNGRAPVAHLASALNASRGTIQTRLRKLVASGAIRRFTIETGEGTDELSVRTVTSIRLAGVTTRQAAKALARIPAIAAAHTTNGKWDVIVQIRVGSLEALDQALGAIHAVHGVTETETSILLTSL